MTHRRGCRFSDASKQPVRTVLCGEACSVPLPLLPLPLCTCPFGHPALLCLALLAPAKASVAVQ